MGTRLRPSRWRPASFWRDKATGERRERTEWHHVVVFNEGLVKVVEQYVKKGSKLYVQGAIQTRKYTDKQGIECSRTEIVCKAFKSEIAMLDRAERAPAPEEDAYGSAQPMHADMGDEVPF